MIQAQATYIGVMQAVIQAPATCRLCVAGTSYIRWGHADCQGSAELVYTGEKTQTEQTERDKQRLEEKAERKDKQTDRHADRREYPFNWCIVI